jgi:hypothetical protein
LIFKGHFAQIQYLYNMLYLKFSFAIIVISTLLFEVADSSTVDHNIIGQGVQPHIAFDTKGIIRVVYGSHDKIYCTISTDNGMTFSTATLVATVPGMHLGMSRGPQIASSARHSVITAMDKSGTIHCFLLNNSTGRWKGIGMINDVKGSAPEGLMSIAADKNDNFYAVWLDNRMANKNQIYFSTLSEGSTHWTNNILAYQSQDGHVCECCKPNIFVREKEVAIMFRNWLDGSRDLYLIKSTNGGRSFMNAQKLGEETWKLNGCPMDGGGVCIDESRGTHTVWQRKGYVYYCKPGEKELSVGKGRICSIATNGKAFVISMQDGDTLKLIRYPRQSVTIGNGSFLQSAVLPNNNVLCVWEEGNSIKFKKVAKSILDL